MKFLMSFVFLIPTLLSAAPQARAGEGLRRGGEIERMPGGGYYPQPGPSPRYCPDGMHLAWDEIKRGYVCIENEPGGYGIPERCPKGMHWVSGGCEYIDYVDRGMIRKMSGLSDAVGGSAANFFDGSNGLASAALLGAVADPSGSSIPEARWKLVHTNPEVPVPTIGKPRPAYFQTGRGEARVIKVIEPEHRDMMQETGQAIQDKIIEKAIDKVIEKVDNANKAIDNIGNGLRSDGDSALQKGTQAQKEAERKYGK